MSFILEQRVFEDFKSQEQILDKLKEANVGVEKLTNNNPIFGKYSNIYFLFTSNYLKILACKVPKKLDKNIFWVEIPLVAVKGVPVSVMKYFSDTGRKAINNLRKSYFVYYNLH